jgi:hypothetical protein
MAVRVGDLIDKAEASEANANDKAEAAVAANQEATDARAVAVEDKKPLARALAKLGEITKPLPDGRFKTFTPSLSDPSGYKTEISAGVDTLVPDDEAPPEDTGEENPPADEEPEGETPPANDNQSVIA